LNGSGVGVDGSRAYESVAALAPDTIRSAPALIVSQRFLVAH
jgi:hypothetical protein